MKKEKTPVQTEPKFDFRTIKTFEEACHKIRVTPALPTLLNGCQELMKATIAAYKLMVIFQAINDGWIPDWSNSNQWKYYPWFRVLSSGFGFSYSNSISGMRIRMPVPAFALTPQRRPYISLLSLNRNTRISSC
jgi:hypothetical protein